MDCHCVTVLLLLVILLGNLMTTGKAQFMFDSIGGTLMIDDQYVFPDTYLFGDIYLNMTYSHETYCMPELPCLHFVVPHGSVISDFQFDVEFDGVSDFPIPRECTIPSEESDILEFPQSRKPPKFEARMKREMEPLKRVPDFPRPTAGKPKMAPPLCGLGWRNISTEEQHARGVVVQIFAKREFCPANGYTHSCGLKIKVRSIKGNSSFTEYRTRIALEDVNEKPVCEKSKHIKAPMVWVDLPCKDRDFYLENRCGVRQCPFYIENEYSYITITEESYPPFGRYVNNTPPQALFSRAITPGSNVRVDVTQRSPVGFEGSATSFRLYYSPVYKIESSGPLLAHEWDSLSLNCTCIHASCRNRSVEWRKISGGGSSPVSDSGLLHFKNLSLNDQGRYFCSRPDTAVRVVVKKRGDPYQVQKFQRQRLRLLLRYHSPNPTMEGIQYARKILNICIAHLILENLQTQLLTNAITTKVNVSIDLEDDQRMDHLFDLQLEQRRYLSNATSIDNYNYDMEAGLAKLMAEGLTLPRRVLTTVGADVPMEMIETRAIEGQYLQLRFFFHVVYQGKQPDRLHVFRANGRTIGTVREDTTVQADGYNFTVGTRLHLSSFIDISVLQVTATLDVASLEHDAADFRCDLQVLGDRPKTTTAVKFLSNILRKAKVTISSLATTVPFNSEVSYQCTFQNASGISYMRYGERQMVRVNPLQIITEKLTAQVKDRPLTVRCSAFNFHSNSDGNITIYPVKNATMCAIETDTQGKQWPSASGGRLATLSCPTNYTGLMKRVCSDNGSWGDIDYSDCRNDLLTAIEIKARQLKSEGANTNEDIEEITSELSSAVGYSPPDRLYPTDIDQAVNVLSDLSNIVSGGEAGAPIVTSNALENVAQVTDRLLSINQSSWDQTVPRPNRTGNDAAEARNVTSTPAGRLVLAMDGLMAASLRDETGRNQTMTIVKENIVLHRAPVSQGEDIRFASDATRETTQAPRRDPESQEMTSPPPASSRVKEVWVTGEESHDVLPQNYVSLDYEAFASINEDVGYGVIEYKQVSDKLARPVKTAIETSRCDSGPLPLISREMASDMLSFTLSETPNNGVLSPRLNLTLSIVEHGNSYVCAFIDPINGGWSDSGCETVILGDGFVECQCDHLTNFAVLMSPMGSDTSSLHHRVLSFITILGCSISIVFLVITVILYIVFWGHTKSERSVIHLNLCVCLVLVYIVFLAGINDICHKARCTLVGVLLHFLLLAVFCLMLAEGVHVVRSVSVVFSRKSVIKPLLVMSYGLPALIVAITLAITKAQDYLSKEYCWLSVETGTLWAFVAPALLVIVINVVQGVVVLKVMLNTAALRNKENAEKARVLARALLVLTPLFGIGWVFGILAVNQDTIAFQYLFAVFNSLQGLFVAIFHCVMSRQIRDGFSACFRKWRRRKGQSTQMTSFNSGTGTLVNSK